jgi:hypothetical protein
MGEKRIMKKNIIILFIVFYTTQIFAEDKKFIYKTEASDINTKTQIEDKTYKISKNKVEIITNVNKEEVEKDKIALANSIILKGAKGAGRTCFSILQDNEYAKNGIYTIMPSDIAFNTYCDMKEGGWSLLSVQIESELLTKNINDINKNNFGQLNKTHRIGNSIVNSIRPYFSWKIEDNKNKVYFQPRCIVNWQNNLNNNKQTFCNSGYDDIYFKNKISDFNVSNYSNGIGMNNEGKYCSIRMFLSRDIFDRDTKTLIEKGTAFNCSGNTKGFVRLWFK